MSFFGNSNVWIDQGNIGEAKAALELIRLGYIVSKPLTVNSRYDLLADNGTSILKVQVKTSSRKSKAWKDETYNRTGYTVNLATAGGNSTRGARGRKREDYDLLFIVLNTGECWIIPADALGNSKTSVCVGSTNSKYAQYKLSENSKTCESSVAT